MPTTEDYLNSLKRDKQNIINSVKAKGVEVQDNATFTDLAGKVEGIPVGIKPEGTINITENGVTDVTNYANANVNVSGGVEEYFNLNGLGDGKRILDTIKKVPSYDLSQKTSLSNAFSDTEFEEVSMMETKTITDFVNMFRNCYSLKKVPLYDTSNAKDMSSMFQNCNNLAFIPPFNTSSVTNLRDTFSNCSIITEIPLLNTSQVTNMNSTFSGCRELKSIPLFNTQNVTMFYGLFSSCFKIEKIPILNFSKAMNVASLFYECKKLTTIGGLVNLGQGYKINVGENDYSYKLDLSYSPLLTHESLMNVINNLYNIKSINVKPQQLILGSTNLAKLTADEIAIATDKGWNVS